MQLSRLVKLLLAKVFSDLTTSQYLNCVDYKKARILIKANGRFVEPKLVRTRCDFYWSGSVFTGIQFESFKLYPIKGSEDVACNNNDLIDFFEDGGPELTDLGETWTDFYENLESEVLDTTDQSEPPEEDEENNFLVVEDGPGDEEEQEDGLDFRSGLNGTEVPEDGSKF